jgi:N-hydroxyarylamine O-acetyltransferase
MTTMPLLDTTAYLRRIGHDGPVEPSLESLRRLHLAHLHAVPFENLDIHLGRPIVLDEARLVDKVVRQRRGGFCYELNGAFAALLRALGFRVTLLSAGVHGKDGAFGPEFDHLLLRVDLDEPWLADVGFGDSFLEPLRLAESVQEQHGRAYRIDRDGEHHTLLRLAEAAWEPQHRFTLKPRALDDYSAMCRYHQTSPESHFTRKRVTTIATPTGRLTLSGARLIVNENGERRELPLEDEADHARTLREHFGIELGERLAPLT